MIKLRTNYIRGMLATFFSEYVQVSFLKSEEFKYTKFTFCFMWCETWSLILREGHTLTEPLYSAEENP
jgi:hypothetical protein